MQKMAPGPAGTGMGTAGSGTAGNIQGTLHFNGYLGGDGKRKKRKIRKDALAHLDQADFSTLYVSRPVVNGNTLIAWAKTQGFPTTVQPDDLHVTIAFSRRPVDWTVLDDDDGRVTIPPSDDTANDRTVERFGDAVVLRFESPDLTDRWLQFINNGASWDFPTYKPHITLSWAAPDLDVTKVVPYRGPLIFGPEVFAPIVEDWKSTITEKMSPFEKWQASMSQLEKVGARNSKTDQEKLNAAHDALVAAGAHCPAIEGSGKRLEKASIHDVRLAKVDETHGLVFGWAVVCKVNGEPYYDLNVDFHSGERVPEHIPENTMLKAATEFMEKSAAANVMHVGPDVGKYLFVWPLTGDIAKAMGFATNTTGLMVAWKPPAEIFAKFKSGELRGFSIEGKRLAVSEHD